MIRFCVRSVDDRLTSREGELQSVQSSQDERLNANRAVTVREDLYSEQVKVRRIYSERIILELLILTDMIMQRQQLHNELSGMSLQREVLSSLPNAIVF